MGKNPLFEADAKDLIMQGLSFRLNPFEGAKPQDQLEKEYSIVLAPRKSYQPAEKPPTKQDEGPPAEAAIKKEEEEKKVEETPVVDEKT